METLVLGPTSISQKIRNSEHLQSLLKEVVAKLGGRQAAGKTGFSSAKHRFDSSVKPLISFITMFEKTFMLAKLAMTLRAGEDHEMHFHEFIVFTSGRAGRVRCLILGLMAEAGSVSLELIRFFDTERFSVSDVHAAISKWAVEINKLFLEKSLHRRWHLGEDHVRQPLQAATARVEGKALPDWLRWRPTAR